MSGLRHGGLFEGYGGTTTAAALALGELDTHWVSDIKPASVRLLAHHHPEVPNLGDMTEIDYTAAPPIDVLTASWPCQPHSSAGRRLGEADPRALWPHVHRAIAETRPAVFLGENVARITGNGELRRVVRSLAELGYVGAWRCVRASDVGACHRRDRCFVVAVDPAADTWREAGREPRHTEQGDGTGPAGIGPAESRRRDHGDGLTLLPTPRVADATRGALRTPDFENHPQRGGADLPTAVIELLPTPTVRDGRRGKGWADLPGRPPSETIHRVVDDGWGRYGAAIAQHARAFGRPAPAPTQISARSGGPQLAPPFVEWMMGLPAGHVTAVPGLTRNEQLSLLGDGVAPAQGAYAFRFLLDHLAQRLVGAA